MRRLIEGLGLTVSLVFLTAAFVGSIHEAETLDHAVHASKPIRKQVKPKRETRTLEECQDLVDEAMDAGVDLDFEGCNE